MIAFLNSNSILFVWYILADHGPDANEFPHIRVLRLRDGHFGPKHPHKIMVQLLRSEPVQDPSSWLSGSLEGASVAFDAALDLKHGEL